MCRTVAALFLAVALATPAQAQEVALALSLYGPFGVGDLGGTLPPSAEFRFIVPLSDRFSLEPFVTVGSYRDRRSAGSEGFYGAQIRQRIARLTREDVYLFASYGAAAYFSTSGSSAPIIGHFGFGLRQRLSEHLAFRPEVQLVTFQVIPIGARFVAGVSIGPRGYESVPSERSIGPRAPATRAPDSGRGDQVIEFSAPSWDSGWKNNEASCALCARHRSSMFAVVAAPPAA